MSFFLMGAHERLKNNQLMRLHEMIDWNRIEGLLSKIHKRDWTRGGGPTPYRPVQMFKAVLLGHWHQLSDQGLVDSLQVRLDFMLFTGFEIGMPLPDESTFCRFRNRLSDLQLDEQLFEEINRQLAEHGLAVKEASMAILDATIIESANRPRRCIEVSQDREEQDDDEANSGVLTTEPQIVESADPDARWLKKGNRFFFGYKGFVCVEARHGFIRSLHVTPANRSEVKEFENAIDRTGSVDCVLADKGYASKSNRAWLKDRGITDGIMIKATQGNPLDDLDKQLNRLISKARYKVERCFGTLKQRFGFSRSRYRTMARVESELYWKAMCFNLLKAERLTRA